ncbi:MAG: glycosyltransferase [Symbiobacteriia bacterium]
MKIAFVLPNLEFGGAELALLSLATLMAEKGKPFDVLLIVGSRKGDLTGRVPPSVRVVELGVPNLSKGLLRLRRTVTAESVDVLFSAMPHGNLLALLAAFPLRKPRVVISEHGNVAAGLLELRPIKRRVLLTLMRLLYPRAAAVLAVSPGLAKEVEQTLGVRTERIHVVRNPVLMPGWREQAASQVQQPWFAPMHETPVLLWVGRMVESKGLSDLISVFQKVRQNRVARLVLIGDGPARNQTSALVESMGLSDDVAFFGFQANPFQFMRAADLFVLSSRWEGFGNVLIEAMACGLPVVSFACDHGPKALIQHGVNGLLAPPRDSEALAEAALQVLAQPQLRASLVQAGKKTAEAFEAHSVAAETEAIIAGLD